MSVVYGLLAKVLLLIVCIFFVDRKFNNTLNVSLAWLMSYLIMIVLMIVLSLTCGLNGSFLIAGLLVASMFIILFLIKEGYFKKIDFKIRKGHGINFFDGITIVVMLVCVATLLYHNIIYYDTTDDALTQGMTKLAFMQQNASIFVRYNTYTYNIFCNEWIGELNALYYLLISHNDHLALMGNFEIYIFIVATIYGIFNINRDNQGKGLVVIGYIATTPVILGLAMTIKSDLISLILLALLVTVIKQYYITQESKWLVASISTIGITAASKITLVPVAGLLSLGLILFYFRKAKTHPIKEVLLGIGIALIYCARYLANLFQYGNPFQRALNEKVRVSLKNVLLNVEGIVKRFCETKSMYETITPRSSSNWVLNKGIGYGGEIILLLIIISIVVSIIGIIKKKKSLSDYLLYLLIPYAGGFLYVLVGTVWYEWSFRYLYPYILVIEIYVLIKFYNYIISHAKVVVLYFFKILFLCMFFLNAVSAFRLGQAVPYYPSEMKMLDKTEKKLAYSSLVKYEDIKAVPELLGILENGGEGLLLDEFSVPFYPFFGDDNCVKIDLVIDEKEMLKKIKDKEYDICVISSIDYNEKQYDKLEKTLIQKGYNRYLGSYGAVFIKQE